MKVTEPAILLSGTATAAHAEQALSASVFNLLNDAWLPIRRRDGSAGIIRPAEITGELGSNPVVGIDWPRADFRMASLEFLIGLIATACPPVDDDETWIERWENPPAPEALAAAFAPIAHNFNLDGPGPRFMQDLEELPGEPDIPETLLIEAPGESTRRKNTALLVKPDRVLRLSRPAAAIALFTLQTYAPAGGRGNLVSLRGGGPLTTLAIPEGQPSLWQLVWANVPIGTPRSQAELPRVFPWLAPTRTADRFPLTIPGPDAHPLQAFWGMPRRIRLDVAPSPDGLACDLTGAVDSVMVTGWRQRPNGVRYGNWDHPLSPYYHDAKSGGWFPVHPQPGGIGYRHWVAMAVGGKAGARRPARTIVAWQTTRSRILRQRDSRLFAAGFDMDNMKARAFVESEMPLPGTDPARAEVLAEVARRLVEAAEAAASALRAAVRDAHYGRDSGADAAPLAAVYESFWTQTHDRFFALLRAAADRPSGDWEDALAEAAPKWRAALRTTALALFDQAAPLDPSAVSFDPKRIVDARRNLFGTFEGWGAFGTKLFAALLLPSPEAKPKSARRSKAKEPA